ncbi:hypothetical protein STREPTOSP366_63900 [Streptomyces variabilis]
MTHYSAEFGTPGFGNAILRGLGAAGRVEFSPLGEDAFDMVSAPGLTFAFPRGGKGAVRDSKSFSCRNRGHRPRK